MRKAAAAPADPERDKRKKAAVSLFKSFKSANIPATPKKEAVARYPQGLLISMWMRRLYLVELWKGDDKWHNDSCEACNSPGNLVCCDYCNVVYHHSCLKPDLPPDFPGRWACPECSCQWIDAVRVAMKQVYNEDVDLLPLLAEVAKSYRSQAQFAPYVGKLSPKGKLEPVFLHGLELLEAPASITALLKKQSDGESKSEGKDAKARPDTNGGASSSSSAAATSTAGSSSSGAAGEPPLDGLLHIGGGGDEQVDASDAVWGELGSSSSSGTAAASASAAVTGQKRKGGSLAGDGGDDERPHAKRRPAPLHNAAAAAATSTEPSPSPSSDVIPTPTASEGASSSSRMAGSVPVPKKKQQQEGVGAASSSRAAPTAVATRKGAVLLPTASSSSSSSSSSAAWVSQMQSSGSKGGASSSGKGGGHKGSSSGGGAQMSMTSFLSGVVASMVPARGANATAPSSSGAAAGTSSSSSSASGSGSAPSASSGPATGIPLFAGPGGGDWVPPAPRSRTSAAASGSGASHPSAAPPSSLATVLSMASTGAPIVPPAMTIAPPSGMGGVGTLASLSGPYGGATGALSGVIASSVAAGGGGAVHAGGYGGGMNAHTMMPGYGNITQQQQQQPLYQGMGMGGVGSMGGNMMHIQQLLPPAGSIMQPGQGGMTDPSQVMDPRRMVRAGQGGMPQMDTGSQFAWR